MRASMRTKRTYNGIAMIVGCRVAIGRFCGRHLRKRHQDNTERTAAAFTRAAATAR